MRLKKMKNQNQKSKVSVENLRYLFDEDKNEDYYELKLINTAFAFNIRVVQIEKICYHPMNILK